MDSQPGWALSIRPRVDRSPFQIHPALLSALRAACRGQALWPVFIHGTTGAGKTCAALSVLDHHMGRHTYHCLSELCNLLIDAAAGHVSTGEPMYERVTKRMIWTEVYEAELAVLDEIGSREKVSDHHYEVIREWLEHRARMPAIVISNNGPDELARLYDDRIVSRLCAGTVVDVSALKDRRA